VYLTPYCLGRREGKSIKCVMEEVRTKDGDENNGDKGQTRKSKKVKRRYKDEREDHTILTCGSETLSTSKKKNRTDNNLEREESSKIVSRHRKKKKLKKAKKIKYANDEESKEKKEEKKENKSKIMVSGAGDMKQGIDDSRQLEEITIMGAIKNDESDKSLIEEEKCKKRKIMKTNLDFDGRNDEMENKEGGISKSKGKQKYDAGQWDNASFDTVEQKNKFIRLLGGFKNKTDGKSSESVLHGLKKFNSAAMNKDEEEKLNKKLETQYQHAFDTSRNRKGCGLGYDASHDTNLKKFHIDVEQPSKSIKFE